MASRLMHLTDWVGNSYGPGDTILYPAMSGQRVTMILAQVVEIYRVARDDDWSWERVDEGDDRQAELRVTVKPLKSSRWQQHYERQRVTLTVTDNITRICLPEGATVG